jgi:GTP cyclohydrolase FolE2
LSSNVSVVVENGGASTDQLDIKVKKKYTMNTDTKAKRKARARKYQILWWRDWTEHKKFRQQLPVEVPSGNDCPCGKNLYEHPSLPNSTRIAINIFCPFVQMKRLGIM